MAIFIFNPFIKIFNIDNSYLLYNPLNQELAIIDKKTYTLFLNGVDLNIYKLDPENCVLYKKIITLLLKDIGKKMVHEKLSKNKRI